MNIQVNNRIIGNYDYDLNYLNKKVEESKHLYQKLDAWGIDARFWRDVLLPRNSEIDIFDKENGILYKTKAEIYFKHGEFLHFKGEEDHQAQVFLSRRYFEQIDTKIGKIINKGKL